MKFKIAILVLVLSSHLFSQLKLESIALGSELSYGIKGINYVNKAAGFGFSGELKFKFDQNSNWKFGFVSGYRDLKLEPSDSMTIERWNWDYWRIWYRSHVRSLISDSNYAVNLNPEQRLYVLPVKIYLGRNFVFNKFTFLTGFVIGLTFYERAFWLNETWWKRFPNVSGGETYVFQYSFKNNAPSKKGTVLNFGVKFEAGFRVTKVASFIFGFEFEHYPSINKIDKVELGKIVLGGVGESYKNFVLRDVFKLTAGFAFNY